MYQSLNFRAKQTSRENKDVTHRTFQEAKRIWEDHGYKSMKFYHAPKRNSDYWLGNTLPHIPTITFKSILRSFCHIYVMQRRHAHQTEDVFLSILTMLTKTGWWIRRPDFYQFSLWFHLKFPIKNNRTLPISKLYKTRYNFTKYYSCNSVACVPLLLILREITHTWRTCIIWRLEAFIL